MPRIKKPTNVEEFPIFCCSCLIEVWHVFMNDFFAPKNRLLSRPFDLQLWALKFEIHFWCLEIQKNHSLADGEGGLFQMVYPGLFLLFWNVFHLISNVYENSPKVSRYLGYFWVKIHHRDVRSKNSPMLIFGLLLQENFSPKIAQSCRVALIFCCILCRSCTRKAGTRVTRWLDYMSIWLFTTMKICQISANIWQIRFEIFPSTQKVLKQLSKANFYQSGIISPSLVTLAGTFFNYNEITCHNIFLCTHMLLSGSGFCVGDLSHITFQS